MYRLKTIRTVAHSPRCFGALVLLLVTSALAVATPATAARVGLECHITQSSPADCPVSGCAPGSIKPHDETRWYIADTVQRHIEEYARNGSDRGAPFRTMVVVESGEWSAEGGDLGPGASSISLLQFNPRTNTGGLSILVRPGGEFGGRGSAYELSARCSSVSVDAVRSDKDSTSLNHGR